MRQYKVFAKGCQGGGLFGLHSSCNFYVQLQRFEATKKAGEWLENKCDGFMEALAE